MQQNNDMQTLAAFEKAVNKVGELEEVELENRMVKCARGTVAKGGRTYAARWNAQGKCEAYTFWKDSGMYSWEPFPDADLKFD